VNQTGLDCSFITFMGTTGNAMHWMSVWVLDPKVTTVKSSTVLGHRQRTWAKLHGPKVEVRQASTCRSPRASQWRRLVLAVTGTHSSWRYSGAVWWWHLKMIKQSLKTQAKLKNYPLWNWQPVKIITKCRCYSIELALPHYKSLCYC